MFFSLATMFVKNKIRSLFLSYIILISSFASIVIILGLEEQDDNIISLGYISVLMLLIKITIGFTFLRQTIKDHNIYKI